MVRTFGEKVRLIKPLTLACGILLMPTATAFAQTQGDIDRARRQQEQIQRQQEERLRPDDPLIPRQLPPGFDRPATSPQTPETAEPAPCFPIRKIEIEGWEEEDLGFLVSDFVGHCIKAADIDAILARITEHFVEQGLVTTRAYVPSQDLRTGILKLIVVEGRVEEIRPAEGASLGAGQLRTAFPGLEGERLNLRDFEQGTDQINRLRYANATVKFEPGSKQGGSVAVIDNPQGKSWRVKGGVDNSGSEATGEIQQVGNAETYNWLGLNDVITVNYGRDSLPSTSISASDSKSISASVPYGYWLLSLSASRFTYQNPIRGTTQTFKSSGATTSYRGDLERVLHRDQVSKTTLTGSLTHKKIKNYVEDLLLDVSSRKLTVAGLLATHSRRLGQGLIAISAGYEVGLRSLGAKDDYDRGLDSPEAQFEKYTADLTIIQNFQLAGLNFVATSGARGQWTPDTLYSSERFSIGSLSTVRGFKESSVIGDIGGLIRNELAVRLPIEQPGLSDVISEFRPFIAADYGVISQDDDEPFEGGRMSGWAIGVRASGEHVELALTYARPIDAPSFIEDRGSELYFSAQLAF